MIFQTATGQFPEIKYVKHCDNLHNLLYHFRDFTHVLWSGLEVKNLKSFQGTAGFQDSQCCFPKDHTFLQPLQSHNPWTLTITDQVSNGALFSNTRRARNLCVIWENRNHKRGITVSHHLPHASRFWLWLACFRASPASLSRYQPQFALFTVARHSEWWNSDSWAKSKFVILSFSW